MITEKIVTAAVVVKTMTKLTNSGTKSVNHKLIISLC